MSPTILISGANRGIGLELARQFGAAGWTVIGTARNPDQAEQLAATGASVRPLDVTSATSVAALAASLQGQPIDAIIANAGICLSPEALAADVTRAEYLQTLRTNTIAPLALAKALRPNIDLGQRKIVTAMSSLMSSISANDWGTQYAYRASKTALNVTWRGLAALWKPDGITVFCLRPGFVATDMTDGKGMDIKLSVAGMLQVVETADITASGRVISYDGSDVPH